MTVGFVIILGNGKIFKKDNSITRINFPVLGGELPTNVTYEVDPSVRFPDKSFDYIFRFVNRRVGKENVMNLRKIFKLENAQEERNREAIIYENEEHFLRLDDDGTFVYHNKRKDDDADMRLSDEVCKKIATDFLRKNDLLPPVF